MSPDPKQNKDQEKNEQSADRWCFDDCKYEGKYEGKSKAGAKSSEMVRCCSCMNWYHEDCVKAKEKNGNFSGVWQCFSCRRIPSYIAELLQEMKNLREDVKILRADQQTSQKSLDDIKGECKTLRDDNTLLKTQVTSLSQQLQKKTWESFTNGNQKSLLIGDSIIRDVDESKLKQTQVTSLPKAKVTDVLKCLQDDEKSYKMITCCVGTNNCSEDNFSDADVCETYKTIIATAKEKVGDPKNIQIVSIPPRTDSTVFQENVNVLNACLSTIANDEGVTFINNDMTFKLSDGAANDGYLQNDGVHLNNKGTNRLAKNMQLKVKSEVTNGNIVKTGRQNKNTSQMKSAVDEGDGDWQNVSYKRGPRRSTKITEFQRQSSKSDNGQRQTNRKCWFCGENNHVSHNCRHGHKITCNSCQQLGHKSKHCVG